MWPFFQGQNHCRWTGFDFSHALDSFSQDILLCEVFAYQAYLQFFSCHQTNKTSTDIVSPFLISTFSAHSHGLPFSYFPIFLKNLLDLFGPSISSPCCLTGISVFMAPCHHHPLSSFPFDVQPQVLYSLSLPSPISPVYLTSCICLLVLHAKCLLNE